MILTEKLQVYRELLKEIMECRKCGLWLNRKNIVVGDGSIPSKLMFVGEAPGKTEDLMGKPFVGKAGELLTSVLMEIGIKRSGVYITNIVKCRPPNNRVPRISEIKACIPYLYRQLEIVKPRIIVALGKTASRYLIEESHPLIKTPIDKKLAEVRGKPYKMVYKGKKIIVVATYHPAAILRNPRLLPLFKNDLFLAKSFL